MTRVRILKIPKKVERQKPHFLSFLMPFIRNEKRKPHIISPNAKPRTNEDLPEEAFEFLDEIKVKKTELICHEI